VLVHKVLGAVSQSSGRSFEEILEIGKSVAENLVTVGVSLGHVHIPGRSVHDQILREDQVEIGMGIHNELECRILRPRPDLDIILEIMLNQLLDMADEDRAFVNFARAEKVVLLVNNLGGLSILELSAITKRVYDRLGMSLSRPNTCNL
jgi:triose/dihydroxyacetone kinase / FAD-AMP lyase (cyclizing)